MRATVVSLFDTGLRLAALGAIWGSAGGALVSIFYMFGFLGAVPAALAGLPVAFIISHVILQRPFITLPAKQEQPVVPPARIEKAKRNDDVGALLNLLDEADAFELRQRIKSRLLDRIEDGSEGEVESFEALLDARERQKRR